MSTVLLLFNEVLLPQLRYGSPTFHKVEIFDQALDGVEVQPLVGVLTITRYDRMAAMAPHFGSQYGHPYTNIL